MATALSKSATASVRLPQVVACIRVVRLKLERPPQKPDRFVKVALVREQEQQEGRT
jgi:hypothetical protein